MNDPDEDRVRELARRHAPEALKVLKELAKSAKDPKIRRQAAQAVEDAERAGIGQLQKKADDDEPST